MRKRGTIFLVFLVFLFSGCSSAGQSVYPADDTYHFETDAQYSCFVANSQRMVAESEKGYYFAFTFRGLRSMFFTDKETMKTVPLCSRPNCLHFEETDVEKRVLCQAYFTGTVGGPSLYYNEGRILIPEWGATASDYNITALDLDGASRRNLLSMEDATDGANFLFHRGYAYCIVNTYNQEMQGVLELRQYSLSRPEKEPRVLFSVKAQGGYLASPLAYGEHLYFYGNVDGEWQVYTVDLRTLECRKLFGDLPIEWPALTVCQDKLYFLMIHTDPGREQYEYASTCYTAELDGSNLQKCWESSSCDIGSDGRYIYEWPIGAFIKMMEEPRIRIRDSEGNLLVEYDPREDGINGYYNVYVMSGDNVLIHDGNKTIYYFSKSEIETGEIHPKVLVDYSQFP